MQAQQQPCPQTPQQIQAQIDHVKWEDHQTELSYAFNRAMQTKGQVLQHEHYMVEQLASPLSELTSLLIVAVVAYRLIAKAIAAGVDKAYDRNQGDTVRNSANIAADIEKNRDDNQSDVRYAQYLIDNAEPAAETQA